MALQDRCMFDIVRQYQNFSLKWLCHLAFPPIMYETSVVPHPCQDLVVLVSNLNHSGGYLMRV